MNREKGGFRAEGSRAAELAETLRSMVGDVSYTNGVMRLLESNAMRLVGTSLAGLLSEHEHEAARLAMRISLGESP